MLEAVAAVGGWFLADQGRRLTFLAAALFEEEQFLALEGEVLWGLMLLLVC
jgi:hypothetical protein